MTTTHLLYKQTFTKLFSEISHNKRLVDVGMCIQLSNRDDHVIQRIIERNIDVHAVLKDFIGIINDKLCEFVYTAKMYVNNSEGFVVRTNAGHMCFMSTMTRCGITVKLSTVTPLSYRHINIF